MDWVTAVRPQAPPTVCTLAVQLGTAPETAVPLWVHAYRLPPAPAHQARRRCRQQHSTHGRQPKTLPLWLAAWVLVVTTLPPPWLPSPMALAVYRVRWQMAVAMQRGKSVLNVDVLRARWESPVAEVWLPGQ